MIYFLHIRLGDVKRFNLGIGYLLYTMYWFIGIWFGSDNFKDLDHEKNIK